MTTARRTLMLLLLASLLTLPLTACGKKGSLEPPEDSEYPKVYPTS